MPVLLVKESCYNKLDNLYRHNNIFGFTYGRRAIWKILGTNNVKGSQEKMIRLEEVNKKQLIDVSWASFLEEFKYSVISCFALNYHLRAISIPSNHGKSKSITIALSLTNSHP